MLKVDSDVIEVFREVHWNLEGTQLETSDMFEKNRQLDGAYKIETDASMKPIKLPKKKVPMPSLHPLEDKQHRGREPAEREKSD